MLVWKFKETDTISTEQDGQVSVELKLNLRVRQTADMAVYSLVKMVSQMKKSYVLQKYKSNPGLKARIKNFDGVKMGFGIHAGWAIEGPIGSEYKIDASYLSPHVNVAGNLEAATKGYGVPLLISEAVQQLMTPKNRSQLRLIDRILIDKKPADIFTVDIDANALNKSIESKDKQQKDAMERKKEKVMMNQIREKLMEAIAVKKITGAIWSEDSDIARMRQNFSARFFQEWETAVKLFFQGKWAEARPVFEKTSVMVPTHDDGPSAYFLAIIEKNNGNPPLDWPGYNES